MNIAFHRKWYNIQNICMFNMFTFDVFSDCYSLGQSWVKPCLAYASGNFTEN